MGGLGSGGAREGSGRKAMDGEPKKAISIRLPPWLLSLIRDEAERRDIPITQLITELLTKGLEL